MHTFDTPAPTRLHVDVGAGDVTVTSAGTSTTTVELVPRGRGGEELAAESTIEQRGDEVVVAVPRGRRHLLSGSGSVDVLVTLPTGSDLRVATESGDVRCTGEAHTVNVRTGSGDVDVDVATGALEIGTGSGDVGVDRAAEATRCTTGSGDVRIDDVAGPVSLKTGSGDLRVRHAGGPAELKSGSGDLTVDHAESDVVLKSGSGDLTVGRVGAARVEASNATGSIRVGVTNDVPAWLDLSTVTGRISSSLGDSEPAGSDEPYLELHARSVSGDVHVSRA